MIKIKKDTREKQGWEFNNYDVNLEIATLKTGDLTVEGLEEKLVIERKATTGELSINIGKKKKAFVSELERMKEYKYKYLILEFSLNDVLMFPENSTIPQKYWDTLRISSNYMVSFLDSLEEKYGIKVIYAENKQNAEEKVIEIIYDILDKERDDSRTGKNS